MRQLIILCLLTPLILFAQTGTLSSTINVNGALITAVNTTTSDEFSTVSASGNYSLQDLPPADYYVNVYGPGYDYLDSNPTSYSVTSGNTTTVDITMVAATVQPSATVANDASELTSNSFRANWEHVSGAEKYYLDIAVDAGFTTFLNGYNNYNAGFTNSSVITISSDLSGNTFYYRVRAYNSFGTSASSNEVTVNLTEPIDVSIQPVFEWPSLAGGADYELNIATDAGMTENLITISSISSTTYDLSTDDTPYVLMNSTTYYWQVTDNGAANTYGPFSFTTVRNVTPYLAAPVSGLQINSPVIELYWNASGDTSVIYDLFYSTTYKETFAGDASALRFTDLTNTVLSVSGLTPGLTYYWQVRTKTKQGGAIAGYSTVDSFVTYGVLTEPVLIYPFDASDSYTVDPYLYWTNYYYSTLIQYKVVYSTSSSVDGSGILDTDTTQTPLMYDLYTQLIGLDGNTTYYWQVAATNNGGGSYAWSDVYSFTTPDVIASGSLLPPTPTYPIDGITVYSSSATFYWILNDYSSNLQYQVRYAQANTTTNGELDDVSATSLPMTSDYYKQVSGLLGDRTYYWQVRTYNGSTFSDWSAVESFYTDESVLGVYTPILLTPGDGDFVNTLQPTLFWYVNGSLSGYEFNVVYNSEGSQDASGNLDNGGGTLGNVLGSGTTNGYFAQFTSPLSEGETYYWQVIGTKNSIVKYSEIRSFTVNTQAATTSAPIPILTSPVGGITVNTVDPVLNWAVNSSYTNLEFEVLYSTDGTISSGVLQNGTTSVGWTTDLFTTLSGLTPGAMYYWQVRSRIASSTSVISDYSTVQSFVVSASIEPVMAILGSPVDGIEIASTNPVLSWVNATGTASSLKYEVEIAEEPDMISAQTITDLTNKYVTIENLTSGKTYYWRVRSKTDGGEYSYYSGAGEFTINTEITDVEQNNSIPTEYKLSQNYPNPFNPATNIRFDIPEVSHVCLKIYDILGREVVTLMNEVKNAGSFNLTWDGRNSNGNYVSTGTYIYRLVAGRYIETKKMILLK